jgi:acyl-CoA synthetase (NDP forming)
MVSFASADNPIDATAHGYNDNFASYSRAIREVLADPNIDQAIARPPRGKSARPWAEGLLELLRETDKPLVLNWPTAPDDNGDVMRYLEENGVPCIMAPGRAIAAMAAVTEFARKCRAYADAPRRPHGRVVHRADLHFPAGAATLGEYHAKRILARYGVPVVAEALLSPGEIEALESAPLAFPLAVKVLSRDVPHKTEAGAVRLNIADLAALKQAAREVMRAARAYRHDAHIDGVLVQEMASGLEVIVGAVNDPYFGPTVAFGLGGIYTELMKDITHRFAPFDVQTAREMIAEIKGVALLRGYRGQPPFDIDALAESLARVSQLIADHADRITEIDVNPLFVRRAGQGVVAADALVVIR